MFKKLQNWNNSKFKIEYKKILSPKLKDLVVKLNQIELRDNEENKIKLASLISELTQTLFKTGEEASKIQDSYKSKRETKLKDPKTWWCSRAQHLHDQKSYLESEYRSSRNEIT